jgi:hypothetical protein
MACEQGKSFLEIFPNSIAATYLTSIVDKILMQIKDEDISTQDIKETV